MASEPEHVPGVPMPPDDAVTSFLAAKIVSRQARSFNIFLTINVVPINTFSGMFASCSVLMKILRKHLALPEKVQAKPLHDCLNSELMQHRTVVLLRLANNNMLVRGSFAISRE